MSWREVVDRSWALALSIGVDDLRQPGVRLVVDPPALAARPMILLLKLGDTCMVAVPSRLAAEAARAIEAASGAVSGVYDAAWALRLAGPSAGGVLGPTWYGYVDAASFVPSPAENGRLLAEHDATAVAALRSSMPAGEWAEGGFVPLPDVVWGSFDEHGLTAAGNLTDWDGRPADVGLVARPDVRGRGVGTALASAMVRSVMAATHDANVGVVRYRAFLTNAASRRVAERLGFEAYGEEIAVRLS